MNILRNIISYVIVNAPSLALDPRSPTKIGMHYVVNFGEVGVDVYRIHKLHMFPTVLQELATIESINEAIAQLSHVSYDECSGWFTIDKV